LTCLTRKDKFVWNEKAKKAFGALKKAFTSTPIFVHAHSLKPFSLEADASDFALNIDVNMVKMDDYILLLIVLKNSQL
jgi:hypothetical protein